MYSREACLLAELVYGSIETDKPITITDFVSIRTDSFGWAYQLIRVFWGVQLNTANIGTTFAFRATVHWYL